VARRATGPRGPGSGSWRNSPSAGPGGYGPRSSGPRGSGGSGGYRDSAGYRGSGGGQSGGATGVFPAAYASVPPGGYPPDPGPGHYHRASPPPRRIIDYPRYRRTGWTRWVPSWKLVSAIIATGFLFLIVGLFAAYSATDLPKADQRALSQTTIIYYSGGKTEIGRLAAQNRSSVELARVPLPVRQAVLAAEDHTFYSNNGVDPASIVRAAWSNLRGNALQGGSTISQQYVKNVYDQRDRSYKRKIKEVFLAVKVNRQIKKDDILERYLNTIYLGRGAYGIQAASQAYFGKDVDKLTVSQGAFLAGIINAPSLADPRDGAQEKARAQRRWNVVLDAMVTEQWLSPQNRAAQKFPKTTVPRKQSSMKGQNGYLITMAQAEAAKQLGKTLDQIETEGYKIVTTFNKNLIQDGLKAVKAQLPKNRPKGLQVGMASIDPETGAVRAIYGGSDYLKRNRNAATQDTAEAGSTFKPFALVAALKDGVSLDNTYSSASPMRIKGKKVQNFGNEQFGYINLIKATQHSVNTVYVQLNAEIGPGKTQAAAWDAGIPKDANVQKNLVNVLGSANPHPIDMASAYATFAAQGIRRTPYTVQSVTRIADRKEVWNMPLSKTKGKRVFDEAVMADATYAMQQVVNGGTGSYARQLGRPVAGKTGTSQDSRSAWFVGFTPQLATAVAMYEIGKDGGVVQLKNIGGVSQVTGGSFPVRIWTAYMRAALDGKPILDFPKPTFGGDVTNAPPVTAAPKPSYPKPTSSPRPTVTTTEPTPTVTKTHGRPKPTITTLPGVPAAVENGDP
jgi:membrane peptidoglycan carboxypeptidase